MTSRGSATATRDPAAARTISFAHLRRMMVPAGIVQFARRDEPDLSTGTCLDDNARTWLVAIHALAADPPVNAGAADEIGERAMTFVEYAQHADGLFFNMADIDGRPLEDVGSDESIGRAVWSIGTAVRCAPEPAWRRVATGLLDRALPAVQRVNATHARAYAMLGLCAVLSPESAWPLRRAETQLPAPLRARARASLDRIADAFVATLRAHEKSRWPWWSDALTWGNARLPEALLRLAIATGDERYARDGLRALDFLASITQPSDMFVPIGNGGWYPRGGVRAVHDQQPIEACAMVDAWLAAHAWTRDPRYLDRARIAYEWFTGRNTEKLPVAVPQTGGCCDGLQPAALNENQGAESTLSFLHASLAMRAATGP